MLTLVFNEVLYRPIFNALIFLYNIIPGHDFGIAIILLTIIIRIVLSPLTYKSIKSRYALSFLQPKIKEIQKKFEKKEEQSKELMKLYKENKVNPASGCLPLLIQIPILLGLYRALINILKTGSLSVLYPFIHDPGTINSMFLGILDLSKTSPVLAILAGASQFFYSKITMKQQQMPQMSEKSGNMQKMMGKQMMYMMPIITVFIAWSFPAGLALYWFISTVLGLAQELYFSKKINGKNKANN
ncbi:YidC/Oxa1 family membrane protein insertase [Patescibacteria group bacterium]|nr:YidC/Oxa1 family membrane protein insertase [Patescibacteria group bacterium]MBU3922886.1 YidC/Oxa1 family membrane protein insertase [Patescibacteria group bacterium]